MVKKRKKGSWSTRLKSVLTAHESFPFLLSPALVPSGKMATATELVRPPVTLIELSAVCLHLRLGQAAKK